MTSINLNGLKENTTIKELNQMEEHLKNFPELKQIKRVMENRNKERLNKNLYAEELIKELKGGLRE